MSHISPAMRHNLYYWNDYKRDMIQKYSPSFIDNCISVYERFEYREALKLGSKISLITHTVEAKTEDQREDLIAKYSRLPYQDALEMTRASSFAILTMYGARRLSK